MNTEPQKQHQWLNKLVGDWTFEAEAAMGPDQPASKSIGAETVRSLGGLWIVAEGKGEMPGGGTGTSLMTLGYDPRQKRYWGTWVGSMMTHLWVYDGVLDPTEKILTLETEGPGMTDDGTMARYKDVIEFKTDDHRQLTSHVLRNDGTWQHFMRANYRRKQ
jgi:hypothetical protein